MTLLRRHVLAAGLAAPGLALSGSLARAAAPDACKVGFFTETKPTMLAKGLGWFDQGVGTKIAWTEYGSGVEINAAMVAGGADFGLATGSVATAAGIAQGLPLKLIGMVDNIGPAEEMTVRKSANITKPADFKGKKVATPFGSTSHFRLLGFLKTNNLSQGEVTVLDMRPDAIVAAWTRGDIDAAYVWAPAKSKLLAAGGVRYVTYKALDDAGYVIADVIVVRKGFAQDYPDAVVGFLKAYGRALSMTKAQPKQAAEIIAKQAGVTPAVATAEMAEYDFVPQKAQLTARWLGPPGKGGAFCHTLKSTADFLVTQKSIRHAPSLTAFVRGTDTSYLAKAVA